MYNASRSGDCWFPQDASERQTLQDELRKIIASPHFCNSKRYPALLRYIVEKKLEGDQDALKERTIGIEVFGRTATYDTNSETIVRVAAGEVRKRLQLYYSEQGKNAHIRIALPPGAYTAEFSLMQEAPTENAHLAAAELADGEQDSGLMVNAAPNGHGETSHFAQQRVAILPPLKWKRPAIAAASAVLLLVAAAGIFYWSLQQSHGQAALREFWGPALQNRNNAVLCSGSITFREGSLSGVTTAHKNTDYPFVSMQNVVSIAKIQDTLTHLGIKTDLAFSVNTSVTELREHPVVLLGGFNNDLTVRLVAPLRYRFIVSSQEHIVDSQHPDTIYARDPSLPYSSADDYAMVARFRDSTIDGWVFVLAGIGRNGTEAAAQFVTTPHYLDQLRAACGGSLANKNLQVILKVNVIDGKTGAPAIVAVHSWK
jgi:hypothetical protein